MRQESRDREVSDKRSRVAGLDFFLLSQDAESESGVRVERTRDTRLDGHRVDERAVLEQELRERGDR